MIARLCLFFKQKTAYEMRISDWSSDVCSSDLVPGRRTESSRQSFRTTEYQAPSSQPLCCDHDPAQFLAPNTLGYRTKCMFCLPRPSQIQNLQPWGDRKGVV